MLANISCTVYAVSITTQVAMFGSKINYRNSFWYRLAAGLSTNYCFMLPSNANNAVVQRAAKMVWTVYNNINSEFFSAEEPNLRLGEKLKIFLIVHWKGLVCIFSPIICSPVLRPFPPENYKWAIYCVLIMAIFWSTECIPLPITGLLPLVVLPLTGVMDSSTVCTYFLVEESFMFIGSLLLAASIEQSGLHKRMAFIAIRCFGYSHVKLLVAIVVIASFVSMLIPSSSATIMMVPIIFGVLKSFEDQKLIKIYDVTKDGDKVASDITTCYFCTATFASTIGSSGTLMGTLNNAILKAYFTRAFPTAPDLFNFTLFYAYTIPLVIVLDTFMILYMLVVFIGVWRPKSAAAKRAKISTDGLKAAEAAVSRGYDAIGPFSFREFMVIIILSVAITALFCRSPEIFVGLNEIISNHFKITEPFYLKDSTILALIAVLMLWLPSNFSLFKTCTAKFHEELPKESIPSVLNWKNVMDKIPFSIMFVVGPGLAIAKAWVQRELSKFTIMHKIPFYSDEENLLFIIILVTMLAIISPSLYNVSISGQAALFGAYKKSRNSFWYGLAAGLTTNYCFMLPTSSNNAVVQRAAKIPMLKMIKAGLGPTIFTILITWLALCFYAPIVWPVLKETYPLWNRKYRGIK